MYMSTSTLGFPCRLQDKWIQDYVQTRVSLRNSNYEVHFLRSSFHFNLFIYQNMLFITLYITVYYRNMIVLPCDISSDIAHLQTFPQLFPSILFILLRFSYIFRCCHNYKMITNRLHLENNPQRREFQRKISNLLIICHGFTPFFYYLAFRPQKVFREEVAVLVV